MNIFDFMGAHPVLTVILWYLFLVAITDILKNLGRALTVIRHGYPPIHCDVDGDFRKVAKETSSDDGTGAKV